MKDTTATRAPPAPPTAPQASPTSPTAHRTHRPGCFPGEIACLVRYPGPLPRAQAELKVFEHDEGARPIGNDQTRPTQPIGQAEQVLVGLRVASTCTAAGYPTKPGHIYFIWSGRPHPPKVVRHPPDPHTLILAPRHLPLPKDERRTGLDHRRHDLPVRRAAHPPPHPASVLRRGRRRRLAAGDGGGCSVPAHGPRQRWGG